MTHSASAAVTGVPTVLEPSDDMESALLRNDSDIALRRLQRWRKTLADVFLAYRAMSLGTVMANPSAYRGKMPKLPRIRRKALRNLLRGNLIASSSARSLAWSSSASGSVGSLTHDGSQRLLTGLMPGTAASCGFLDRASPRLLADSPEPDAREGDEGCSAGEGSVSLLSAATQFLVHSYSIGLLDVDEAMAARHGMVDVADWQAMCSGSSSMQAASEAPEDTSGSLKPCVKRLAFLSDDDQDLKPRRQLQRKQTGGLVLACGKPLNTESSHKQQSKKKGDSKTGAGSTPDTSEGDSPYCPKRRSLSGQRRGYGRSSTMKSWAPRKGTFDYANDQSSLDDDPFRILPTIRGGGPDSDASKQKETNAKAPNLADLSYSYHVQLDDLKAARDEFAAFDPGHRGEISYEQFKNLIRARCRLRSDEDVPYHLLAALRRNTSGDNTPVTFEAFLLWSIHCAYAEEFLVPDPRLRHIRQLARDYGFWLPDVEKVKEVFDGFDTDGSGEIEEDEFKAILYRLMNVKSESDVSDKKLERYWRELDSNGTGGVGFDEFLTWYANLFPQLFSGC